MGPAGGETAAPAGPRLRRILMGVVVIALVGSACGDDDAAAPATRATTITQAATTTATPTPDRTALDIQGHRGARGLRPENTLPAFETALDLGVTTLEFDLHFTSDGNVVVWHDPQVDSEKCGLGAGAPVDVPDPDDVLVASRDRMIRALTADQLAWYRCDRNPSTQRFPAQTVEATALAGDNYGIVTLGELFDFVATYATSDVKTGAQREGAARVVFNIETKRRPDEPGTIGDDFDGVNAGAFELELLRVIAEHDVGDRVVVQSFDHRSLWAVHAVDSSIVLAALSVRGPVDMQDLAARGASIWSPNQDAVTSERLQEAHDAGLEVIPWTVNEPEDMQRLIDLGVDGLITDRPDVLIPLATG